MTYRESIEIMAKFEDMLKKTIDNGPEGPNLIIDHDLAAVLLQALNTTAL